MTLSGLGYFGEMKREEDDMFYTLEKFTDYLHKKEHNVEIKERCIHC